MRSNEIILRERGGIPAAFTGPRRLEELWLGNERRSSPHTKRAYAKNLAAFFAFVAASAGIVEPIAFDAMIGRITFDDVDAWAQELKARGLADRSRNAMLSAVKSFFAFAARLGRLPFDVAHPLTLIAPRESLHERILSEDQVQQLIDAAYANARFGERDGLIAEMLYRQGLRIEELEQLRWRDVIDRDGLRLLCVFGKGRKSRQLSVVDDDIWRSLLARRGEAAQDARIIPLSKSQMARRIKLAVRRAGLNGHASPHWLRHSFASHSIRHGAKIDVVSRDMGHSSIKTTNQYVHAPAEESAAAFLPKRRRAI